MAIDPAGDYISGDLLHFAIWSDSLLAAEELQSRLSDLGHRADVAEAGYSGPVNCLVTLRRDPRITPSDMACWVGLVNQSKVDAVVSAGMQRPNSEVPWQSSDLRLEWDGDLRKLRDVSKSLARYVPALSSCSVGLPAVIGCPIPLTSNFYCHSYEELREFLSSDNGRIVMVRDSLLTSLFSRQRADSREDYDLGRVVSWGSNSLNRTFISRRLANASLSQSPFPGPGLSLYDVIRDPRATSLILLLGEPGAGKTLQLRYLDARCALDSLRAGDGDEVLRSFYVPLAEQPTRPDITVRWLEARWTSMINVEAWCDFKSFISGGGVLLLDGFNEGTKRAIPLDEWMMQWRDVVAEIYERGARRVVVTCRTRDQLIPLRSARGEEPTSIALSPLLPIEIEAIAVHRAAPRAERLILALQDDPELLNLYSNPFRLESYLSSGTATVARSNSRLLGLSIAAAILREREQLNFHGSLIPERAAAALTDFSANAEMDPWPVLSEIPLVRALGALARELTLPHHSQPAGRNSLSIADANRVLLPALTREGADPQDFGLAIEAAKDLHILSQARGGPDTAVRFAHPTVQDLFAALGCTAAEVVSIVASDTVSSIYARSENPPTTDATPSARARPVGRTNDSPHKELARFSCELKGDQFLRELGTADPVLAAQIYLSSSLKGRSTQDQYLKDSLLSLLDTEVDPTGRIDMLLALGELGWRHVNWQDGIDACTSKIPADDWMLGLQPLPKEEEDASHLEKALASERRTIRLDAFRIQRFTVTNGEYAEFIRQGGYEDRSLWTVEGWEWRTRSGVVETFVDNWSARRDILRGHPERIVSLLRQGRATPASAAALMRLCDFSDSDLLMYARRSLEHSIMQPGLRKVKMFANPLQPIIGVSWFEANAYCEWLSNRLAARVRLPSENEWEAACTWALGQQAQVRSLGQPLNRELPLANTVEIALSRTTPVGAFATPAELAVGLPADLIGNCFEWVFDPYGAGDHIRKILKGGSWRQEAWRACGPYRGRGDAGTQNDDIGFRCVVECGD